MVLRIPEDPERDAKVMEAWLVGNACDVAFQAERGRLRRS